MEKVQAQDLLSRFRSKEDIYRYMVHQGKCNLSIAYTTIVGIFLPSINGTKLSFMRDILKEEKMALK